MSAPHTDPEKQKKRHRFPLLGMRAVIIWALVLLALLAVFVTVRGNAPDEEGVEAGMEDTIEEVQGTE